MEFSLRTSPLVAAPQTTGVILAIDYGKKRLGLALSDEQGVTSRPLAIWTRINRRRDLARLRELVRKERIRRIVVGLPLHLDGTPSEMSEEVKAFAARVEKDLGIRVELMDERLSSWEAKQTPSAIFRRAPLPGPGRATGSSARKSRKRRGSSGDAQGARKVPLDDVAAAIILRDYLDKTMPRAGLQD
jgi:putative transcription antitermination factor YqgF